MNEIEIFERQHNKARMFYTIYKSTAEKDYSCFDEYCVGYDCMCCECFTTQGYVDYQRMKRKTE
jgi:hypothetical protein